MKKLTNSLLVGFGLLSSNVFAINPEFAKENKARNMAFVTEAYRAIYENNEHKPVDPNTYLSKDVIFSKNLDKPLNYDLLLKHVLELKGECVKAKIYPFDEIFASGNQVVVLYTRNCVDQFNNINSKRVMTITTLNREHKISEIKMVTYENEG